MYPFSVSMTTMKPNNKHWKLTLAALAPAEVLFALIEPVAKYYEHVSTPHGEGHIHLFTFLNETLEQTEALDHRLSEVMSEAGIEHDLTAFFAAGTWDSISLIN